MSEPDDQEALQAAAERLGEAMVENVCVGCGCPIVEPFGPDEIPICRACLLIGGGE